MLLDYLYQVGKAIEFLIAFASLMAFLGLIFGITGLFLFSKKNNAKTSISVICLSIVVLSLTGGLFTGIHYFRLHV
ncbi:MAG: hypothetical protein ACTSR8_14105 [Promethearchaeota archaeon]